MVPRAMVLLTLVLTLTLAGCLVHQPDGAAGAKPAQFPSSEAFREDPAEIEALERFLLDTPGLLDCTFQGPEEQLVDQMKRSHLVTLSSIVFYCWGAGVDERGRWTSQVMAEDTANKTFEETWLRALQSHGQATRAIDNHSRPATHVELQFIAALMAHHYSHSMEFELARSLLDEYMETNEKMSLQNALGKLKAVADQSRLIEDLIEAYPWRTGECDPPAGLNGRVWQKYDDVLALAVAQAAPGDEEWLSTMLGKHLRGVRSYLEHHEEHGWWVAMLRWDGELDWDRQYWVNLDRGRSISASEALEVISVYQANGRTLMTDKQIEPNRARAVDAVEHGWPWPETMAVSSGAIPALRWAYGDVGCPESSPVGGLAVQ